MITKYVAIASCVLLLLVGCNKSAPNAANEMLNGSIDVFLALPDPYDARAAAPPNFKLPDGTLDNLALANFAKMKRDAPAGDAFSKGFDDSNLAGRRFSIIIPLSERNDETAAVWRYDKDEGTLLLELDMEYSADLNGQMATFQWAKETLPSRPMGNAFGATVDVARSNNWSIGVGTTSGYAGIIPKDNILSTKQKAAYGYLTAKVKMPGEMARKLVPGMIVQIDGTVLRNDEGNTIHCSQRTTEAKINQPNESHLNTCLVQSKFTKIAFVAKDGTVLKVWSR